MMDAVFHGRVVEIRELRAYNGKHAVPSKPSTEEKEERELEKKRKVGGWVATPPFGIFDNCGVFDMSRYYAEILIAKNLSPEAHPKDELGIIPQMTLELIEERLRYDRELARLTAGTEEYNTMKYRRNSVKYITEAIIGSFGSEYSRLFDIDIFNEVTMTGQRGIKFIEKLCDKYNFNFIYSDTDGASIQVPDLETAKAHVDEFNEALKEFGKQEGITRELSLKLDRYFRTIGFKKLRERVGGQWIERGTKKKYFGRVIWEDNKECDYLLIKGFEYVRRDASVVTKAIQPSVFDLMLEETDIEEKKEKVTSFLYDEIERIKTDFEEGKITIDDIAIPKTLQQRLGAYGRLNESGERIAIPDYVRGSLYANEWFEAGIHGGDQVKMVYVKDIKGYPPTNVICYISKDDLPLDKIKVNLDKMLDRTVYGKLEDVISLIGLDWKQILEPTHDIFS